MNNPIPLRGKPGEEVCALVPIGCYNAQGWFVLYFTPHIPNRSNHGTGGPRPRRRGEVRPIEEEDHHAQG